MARTPGIVKINRYQQRTTPSGPSRPAVQAQQIPDQFGGMLDGLAEGGAKFADMMERGEQVDLAIENIQIARDEDDARAYSARAVADATARYQARAAEVEAEAPDGWRGYTENFNLAAAEINDDIVGAAPTPIARQFVEQHLGLLRSEMVGRAAARERDLRGVWRGAEFDATVETWSNVLLTDPTQWARAHTSVNSTIGSATDMTVLQRRERLRVANERLAFFTVSGMMERDPAGVMAQLQAQGNANANPDRIAQVIGGSISSTQRTPAHNAEVGGVPNSMHLTGEAVDLTVPERYAGMNRAEIEADVQRRLTASGVTASEVIFEGDHIHVGWRGAGAVEGGAQPAADSPFAYLTPEHRLQLLRQQSTQVRDLESQARTLWEAGQQAPGAPTVEAVRAARGDVAAADYAVAFETFRARSDMNTRTNDELTRIANTAPLQTGTDRERLDSVAQRNAATQILALRSTDPRAYDQQQGILPHAQDMGEAIASGDITQVGTLLRRRVSHASEQAERLGPLNGPTSQLSPLTRNEAAHLRGTLDRLTPDQRLAALSALRQSASLPRRGDSGAYSALITQLYADNPGALAGAGLLPRSRAAIATESGPITGEVAARRLMSGAALLNPPPQDANANGRPENQRSVFNMPASGALEGAFNEYVGDAYANDPDAYNNAFQAFRAYYAGTASERGLDASGLRYSVDAGVMGDSNIVQLAGEAAQVAVGNLRTNRYGGRAGLPEQTYLPWGMDEGMFMRSLESGWDSIRSRYAGAELRDNPEDYDYAPDENGFYMVFYRGRAVADGEGGLVLVRPRLNGQ